MQVFRRLSGRGLVSVLELPGEGRADQFTRRLKLETLMLFNRLFARFNSFSEVNGPISMRWFVLPLGSVTVVMRTLRTPFMMRFTR